MPIPLLGDFCIFLTHSSLIFSLASGINVFTLNENTEFLTDSLGLGARLILFLEEK